MPSLFSCLTLLLLAALSAVQAVSTTGSRLLAILDDPAEKASYSKFLGDLEGRGFSIAYESPKSDAVSLFHLGERAYDHVILFPTKTKGLGPNLTPQLLVKFLNAQGNIIVALSSTHHVPTSIVSLLSELDIVLPADRAGLVVDHFAYDAQSAADLHDVVLVSPAASQRAGVHALFADADADTLVAFPRGIGHVLGSASPLLAPVLDAPRTAYSYNPKEQPDTVVADVATSDADLFAAGAQLKLVSALQARNSARLALVGSAEMLTDAWFDAKVQPAGAAKAAVPAYNREFARRLSGWTFQETGVLRVNWIEHALAEEGAANETNPKIYRVKNDVTYAISLSEYAWDKWTPFVPPAGDAVQLEFSMLSPFHRLDLQPLPERSSDAAAAYGARFTLPDQHGIFNFLVDYRRPLLTYLSEKITVSVRHMAHDEWPRSFAISGAWPWIAGIGATVVGWLAFCALWMFSQPSVPVSATKKTQ